MKLHIHHQKQRPLAAWNRCGLGATLAALLLMSSAAAQLFACEVVSFQADVLVTITSVEGQTLTGVLNGEGTIGGVPETFEGDLSETLVGLGAAAVGQIELRFEDDWDSSLILLFADAAASGLLHGGWTIVSGTGRFENAQGGGWGQGFFLDESTDPPQDPDQPQMAFFNLHGTLVAH